MTDMITLNEEGMEQIALRNFVEQSYLNYSMYVINDRALPHNIKNQHGLLGMLLENFIHMAILPVMRQWCSWRSLLLIVTRL